MPWQEVTMQAQRLAFVRAVLAGEASMSALCRAYGISRKTGYKWLGRYREEGEAGLVERSRRPHASPRRTAPAVEEAVVAALTMPNLEWLADGNPMDEEQYWWAILEPSELHELRLRPAYVELCKYLRGKRGSGVRTSRPWDHPFSPA